MGDGVGALSKNVKKMGQNLKQTNVVEKCYFLYFLCLTSLLEMYHIACKKVSSFRPITCFWCEDNIFNDLTLWATEWVNPPIL